MLPSRVDLPAGLRLPDDARIFPQLQGYLRVLYYDPESGKKRWIMLHRLVYDQFSGPIPKGYYIHHLDGNILNNEPENLIALSPSEHSRLHRLRPELKSPQCASFYAKHVDRFKEYYRSVVGPKRRQTGGVVHA